MCEWHWLHVDFSLMVFLCPWIGQSNVQVKTERLFDWPQFTGPATFIEYECKLYMNWFHCCNVKLSACFHFLILLRKFLFKTISNCVSFLLYWIEFCEKNVANNFRIDVILSENSLMLDLCWIVGDFFSSKGSKSC